MTDITHDLWRFVALRSDYPAGECWAWIDRSDKRCGRPESDTHPHLCARHIHLAERRYHQALVLCDEATAALRKRHDWMLERLPSLRVELDQLDQQISRLAPPPPTTDMAAFGGVLVACVERWQARTDSQIPNLAALVRRRDRIASEIASAERIEACRKAEQ